MDLFSVGEMLVDFIPGEEQGSFIQNAGGAPANVAIAVARNGLEAGFCGMVGNDGFGKYLVQTLHENKVQYLCNTFSDKAVTTMAFVSLKNGERSFTFARKPGADMLLEMSDVNVEEIKNSKIVHAGSFSLSKMPARDTTKEVLKSAKTHGKIVSFDVNYRDLAWESDADAAREQIFSILSDVDLLKVSEEEVDLLGGADCLLQLMADFTIAVIVVTLGDKGSICYWNDERLTLAAWKKKAVDTTGAGDAFWGGFLSSLLIDQVTTLDDLSLDKLKTALKYGTIAGGLCVQSKGAIHSLPSREKIEENLIDMG